MDRVQNAKVELLELVARDSRAQQRVAAVAVVAVVDCNIATCPCCI